MYARPKYCQEKFHTFTCWIPDISTQPKMHEFLASVGKWSANGGSSYQDLLVLLDFMEEIHNSPKPRAQGSSPCTPAETTAFGGGFFYGRISMVNWRFSHVYWENALSLAYLIAKKSSRSFRLLRDFSFTSIYIQTHLL